MALAITVLSTLPHYACLLFTVPAGAWLYSATVAASTTLSVAWHAAGEPGGPLFAADYAAAGMWTAVELWHGWQLSTWHFLIGAGLNAWACAANWYTDWAVRRYGIPYKNLHSIWHGINVSKAVFMAGLLLG